jgi:hypothetical protein
MKPFPVTVELLHAAKRIIWFKSPEEALANPIELMAYAMKASTDEDMRLLLDYAGREGLIEAIDHAPAGIIDPRSWAYWNAKIGRYPAPAMPRRPISQPQAAR